ncbi:MAG TPA: hypothetical protein VML19_05695 [Verrucomicrobiae bacterium]|nr:hypothetical protein [Verrucomicrobiae bacterium]
MPWNRQPLPGPEEPLSRFWKKCAPEPSSIDPWKRFIGEVYEDGVDGVLGASWLVRHDYLLDYRNRRVVLDGAPAESRVRVPLRCTDGRPVVVASIDGRSEELVVDSGSPTVVLYEKPSGAGATVLIDTNEGSTPAQRFRAPFALPGGGEHLMGAVRVDVRGPGARTASGQRIPVGICVQSRGIRAIHALVGLGGRNG